jgi:hypothetical protein
MKIEDFIKAAYIKEFFESIDKERYRSVNYTARVIKYSDTFAQLKVQRFSDGWRESNADLYFADIHIVNDNLIHFSRSGFDENKKSLLYSLRERFDISLHSTITIDEKQFRLKRIGRNFLYIAEDLPDDQIIEVANDCRIVKARCTEMGGICVPSKRAQRYFIIYPGFIYTENIMKPISYNPKTPIETLEDVLTLASVKGIRGSRDGVVDINELRNGYTEQITAKLLKL